MVDDMSAAVKLLTCLMWLATFIEGGFRIFL